MIETISERALTLVVALVVVAGVFLLIIGCAALLILFLQRVNDRRQERKNLERMREFFPDRLGTQVYDKDVRRR